MPERQRMTTRLKTLFQRPELFVLAGGINPIGAKMAEALGYDAFYMSGGNTSAHQLGWPDSGTSMRDMVDNARKIVLTVQIRSSRMPTPVMVMPSVLITPCGNTFRRASLVPTLKTRHFRRNPAPAAAVSQFRRWSESSGRRWMPNRLSTRTS